MPTPTRHSVSLTSDGSVAAVTADVWDGDPAAGTPVVVLAHGAGSRVDHPVHRGVCAAAAAAGLTVVGFNFPYAQAGRKSPDRTERLLSCYRDVANWVGDRFGRGVVGGGRSMGGRMASLLAADGYPFAGIALLNYPLVASRGGADRPPRTEHWPKLGVPVLFVHGTRDALFPAAVYDRSRHLLSVPVTTHVITDADHVFSVLRRTGRTREDVYAEVGQVLAGWLTTLKAAA